MPEINEEYPMEFWDWIFEAPWPIAVGVFAAPFVGAGVGIGWLLFG